MERRLPPQYAGWQTHEPALRRMTTPELVMEIQDGPPDRRLAALSVIDLADVAQDTLEDWIRTLPEAEANELAGAIPASRPNATCADDLRWVDLARKGYDRRRLPTFLVMLFSSLEAMEARECAEAPGAWETVADWLGDTYDRAGQAGDTDATEDILLFVFENHLRQAAVFEAFLGLIARHEELAERVSTDPAVFLADLPEAMQRGALEEAARSGGLPLLQSLARLYGAFET
ncbi:MAG: hypothetical protein U0547_12850 [Dehalococcoidia bacterium]